MHLQNIAGSATTTSAISLAGAGAMYFAVTFLLMILTAHQVTAGYDKKTARQLEAHEAAAYEAGALADARDCVMPASGEVSRAASMRSNALESVPLPAEAAISMAQQPQVLQQRSTAVMTAPQGQGMRPGASGKYEVSRYSAYV